MKVLILNKAGFLTRASLFFITSLVLLLTACNKFGQSVPIVLQGKTMGTTYHITIANPPKHIVGEQQQIVIDDLLVDINQQMSTYIEDSEISFFNQAPINQWVPVSPDFIEVVALSQKLSELSQGKFDITIGPLVDLWGFGRQLTDEVPTDIAIEETKAQVGWRALNVDEKQYQLLKTKPIALNLSAIAKGFGVDKISQYLMSVGIDNYLVEIGGEIRVSGLSPKVKPWRLGIEKPTLNQQGAQQIVTLNSASIATSGDYRNYFEEEGLRYSHTINPVSGKPVRHNIASVTVIATTAAIADGYATVLNVMGLEDALSLAEAENIAAFFILYDQTSETGYREVMTSQFDQYFAP